MKINDVPLDTRRLAQRMQPNEDTVSLRSLQENELLDEDCFSMSRREDFNYNTIASETYRKFGLL